ncbi:MAG: BTAD domain-containing putative transcriptional regulator, partial [Eubacterium sp.]
MDKISVHLLGNPYVEKNGIPVHFPYKKAEGFFYYLCVYKKTTRGEIISILWGDNEESAGRKGLRDAIYQIKKLFGKAFLVTKGNTMIEINPEYMPEIDWDDAVGGDHILDFENKGFMSHFLVKNSYEFEEWIMRMQEQYNAMYISAARKMMDKAKQEKNKAALQRYGNILLVSDPYNEELYYEIMEIYAQNGNYNAAVKLYNDLCRVLSKELGIEPAEKVKGLFNQILNLAEKPEDEQASLDSFFYGRSKEIYETSGELSAFFSGAPAKSVCFCGEAGI